MSTHPNTANAHASPRLHTLQRLTATALAVALAAGSAGCASPYHFSPRLDTRLPQEGAALPDPPLAGDLHLSLAALMDQRRMLWQAAGEADQMKNATALGLIGLGAAAIYRGARYSDNQGWMQRAGLLGATVWAGATWLEPNARQGLYLQGAMSLTCLALATGPYEMTKDDYKAVKENVHGARNGLEALATALRLAGRYEKHTEAWWLARGGWNKLRWANRVLDNADAALGNIEQAGPRLRDMSALLASDTAEGVKRVSKDLSELPAAIASLKPNVAKLVGADVFAPPAKDAVDEDPPGGATGSNNKDSGDKTDTKAADPACSARAPASSASAPPPKNNPETDTKKAVATSAAASAARAAEQRQQDAEREAATTLRGKLERATAELDKHLGAVASFVKRVASARNGLELPKGCAAAAAVTLVPDKRDLVLQAGESFQFVLEGDSGKAAASFLGLTLTPDVLDITMPLVQATTAVRLTAGTATARATSTVVRISDSRREKNFDITVKVCPAAK